MFKILAFNRKHVAKLVIFLVGILFVFQTALGTKLDNSTKTNLPVSMSFAGMDIHYVLEEFADMVEVDLVVSPEVKGKITMSVKNVSWQEALDAVLKTHNLTAEFNKNILIVLPKNSANQTSFAPNMYLEIIPIKYTKAQTLANLLEKDKGQSYSLVSKHGRVLYDERTNYLIVRDNKSNILEIKKLIANLDIRQKQILIETYIVISSRNNMDSLGINWQLNQNSYPALGQGRAKGALGASLQALLPSSNLSANHLGRMAFGILTGDSIVLNLELAALELEGSSKILSAPKIITLNRKLALIKSGEQIPYQKSTKNGNTEVEFKDALLSLEVLPKIVDKDFIDMELKINKDNPGQRVGENFAIETNFIQTQVIIKNKDTLVIGGVMNSNELKQLSKIPFFSDIPIIGNLFKRQEQSSKDFELIIFIRPSIMSN